MSIAPDPARPLHAATPPAMRPEVRSLRWRILHSLWLVVPAFGFGCLGGAAFIYLGLRARRKAWWISGIGYLAICVTAVAFIDEPDESTLLGNLAVAVLLAAWAASIAHGIFINSEWLRYQATRAPWYHEMAPPPSWHGNAAADMPAQPPPAPGIAPDLREFYAPGPAATAGPAASPSPLLDVNNATASELAVLPGLDAARAQRLVAERQARRGFRNVQEFGDVAGLAPHEFVMLRRVVTCTAPPDRPAQPGARILDV